MKFLVAFSFVILAFWAEKVKVWKEKNGVVVVEAEHVQNRNSLPPYWQIERAVQGYANDGFIQWKGESYTREKYSDINKGRILTYYVAIQKEGNYYFKGKGICFDESEAEFIIRINGGEWIKFSIPNDGNVNWDDNSLVDSYPIFLPLGYHKIEVVSVSSGFLFDKFILVHGTYAEGYAGENFALPFASRKESKSEYIEDENFPTW